MNTYGFQPRERKKIYTCTTSLFYYTDSKIKLSSSDDDDDDDDDGDDHVTKLEKLPNLNPTQPKSYCNFSSLLPSPIAQVLLKSYFPRMEDRYFSAMNALLSILSSQFISHTKRIPPDKRAIVSSRTHAVRQKQAQGALRR